MEGIEDEVSYLYLIQRGPALTAMMQLPLCGTRIGVRSHVEWRPLTSLEPKREADGWQDSIVAT